MGVAYTASLVSISTLPSQDVSERRKGMKFGITGPGWTELQAAIDQKKIGLRSN
jgi:hypothetical protein